MFLNLVLPICVLSLLTLKGIIDMLWLCLPFFYSPVSVFFFSCLTGHDNFSSLNSGPGITEVGGGANLWTDPVRGSPGQSPLQVSSAHTVFF